MQKEKTSFVWIVARAFKIDRPNDSPATGRDEQARPDYCCHPAGWRHPHGHQSAGDNFFLVCYCLKRGDVVGGEFSLSFFVFFHPKKGRNLDQ